MNDLVERLATGVHPLAYIRRDGLKGLKESIGRGFVMLAFTGTRGVTELGFRLDETCCNFQNADFDNGQGALHLEGELTLDDVPARVVADVTLATLAGTGCLRLLG